MEADRSIRTALADLCRDKRPDDYVFVSEKTGSCIREVKKGFHTACRIAGIAGLILERPSGHVGPDWPEAGCDAFTIAQLLGHSDVRVTMRYVRAVETSKRVAVEAVRLNSEKVGHVLASWPKQPATALAVSS